MKKSFLNLVILTIVITISHLGYASSDSTDFDSLANAPKVNIPEVSFHKSFDGTLNSFYRFPSSSISKVAVIVLHGGGAHSTAGYQHIGKSLSEDYQTNVYLYDLRGHGLSSGKRGSSPRVSAIRKDLKSFIEFVKKSNEKVYILGHSSGAGLLLNYSTWKKKTSVNGYFFISPQFGYKAEIERDIPSTPAFAKIDLYKFIIASSTFGLVYGKSPAVHFNYPQRVLNKDPLLNTFITRHMSVAMTPKRPIKQFKQIDRPYALFAAENDNLIDPNKVMKFCDYSSEEVNRVSVCESVDEGHLSILINIGHRIGEVLMEWN